jgi:hypothetical protein
MGEKRIQTQVCTCAKIIFFSKNGTGAPTVICMEMNFDPYFMLYRKIN